MKQLAIISGKGGTGKTSLTAAFSALARSAVLVDCDVDAADLHLIMTPKVKSSEQLPGGLKAVIDPDQCTQCGQCIELCRFEAVDHDFKVDGFLCEGCGVCADNCPVDAISLNREIAGQWFESNTRFGPMVHAKLGIAQENSGKLVAQIRSRAMEIAGELGLSLVLIDGPPGIGCPVISSVTGTDLVLAVTEPTPSGLHDLGRVIELAEHFRVPVAVCVNKADLDPEQVRQIRSLTVNKGHIYLGEIPFDSNVTKAMMAEKALPEIGQGQAASAIGDIWNQVKELLQETGGIDL